MRRLLGAVGRSSGAQFDERSGFRINVAGHRCVLARRCLAHRLSSTGRRGQITLADPLGGRGFRSPGLRQVAIPIAIKRIERTRLGRKGERGDRPVDTQTVQHGGQA